MQFPENSAICLYNITSDIGESSNIIDNHEDVLLDLLKKVLVYKNEMVAGYIYLLLVELIQIMQIQKPESIKEIILGSHGGTKSNIP